MSIQEKKILEDIELYKLVGLKFGAILEGMMRYIQTNNIVKRDDLESFFERAVSKLVQNSYFIFRDQINLHNEKFDHSICFSVNNCIAHGKETKLAERGDIVSIDTGFSIPSVVRHNRRLHFDAAFTLICGTEDTNKLTEAPREALEAISMLTGEIYTSQLSMLIEAVGESRNLQIVNYLTGHGIGYSLHEPPIIFNVLSGQSLEKLIPGTIICPEPMYVDKADKNMASIYLDVDGWSVMADNLSSHWETMFYYDGNRLIDIVGISK
jgi:methionine aminopeptidase